MTPSRSIGWKVRTGILIALAGLACAGVGSLAAHEWRVATAQARGLVTTGQRDLLASDRPQAVLSLERARVLAPRAGFVRQALTDARVQQPGSSLAADIGFVGPHEWSFLVLLGGWVAGLCWAARIARVSKSAFLRRFAWVASLSFALSVGGALVCARETRALSVVTHATGLLVSPYDGAGATANLTPGMVVITDARYGAFVRVRGPDGARGWIPSSQLEPVVGT